MNIPVTFASILLGLLFVVPPVQSQTVKKWVDEDGVTHYSDRQPAAGEVEVEEVDVPEAGVVTEIDTQEANQRIQKQLEQLEQDRKAREQEARQRDTEKALEEALEREPLVAEEKKKKKKKRRGNTGGPYPRPPPGPFPQVRPGL
jgi:UPF0716 family protein affecting phage T7 exclusion